MKLEWLHFKMESKWQNRIKYNLKHRFFWSVMCQYILFALNYRIQSFFWFQFRWCLPLTLAFYIVLWCFKIEGGKNLMLEEHVEINYNLVCACHWIVACLDKASVCTCKCTGYKILCSKTFWLLNRFQIHSRNIRYKNHRYKNYLVNILCFWFF